MSKSANIFIDGGAGTTGLEIRERLAGRSELSLIVLPDAQRKDAAARKGALNSADVVILCLPDEAAREGSTRQAPTGWPKAGPMASPNWSRMVIRASRQRNG
jgi:N-acetyl-gamma-glutamylphosphate reductase